MPVDHCVQRLDDEKRLDRLMLKHRLRRVTETEAADDDIETPPRKLCQSQPRQRDFGGREQTRHEILVTELDLEDIDPQRQFTTAAQAQRADRRGPIIELFKIQAHPNVGPYVVRPAASD